MDTVVSVLCDTRIDDNSVKQLRLHCFHGKGHHSCWPQTCGVLKPGKEPFRQNAQNRQIHSDQWLGGMENGSDYFRVWGSLWGNVLELDSADGCTSLWTTKSYTPNVNLWQCELHVNKDHQKSKRVPKKHLSALLTMPKPLTVWITINCGKFWKIWEYQTTWPASWEIYMRVRKHQLELDMEQQSGSK